MQANKKSLCKVSQSAKTIFTIEIVSAIINAVETN